MLVCADWLAVDFFARRWPVLALPDGSRAVLRYGVPIRLPAPCGHYPADCPPHKTTEIRKDRAA